MTKIRHTEIRTVEIEVSFIYRPAEQLFPRAPKRTNRELSKSQLSCNLERLMYKAMFYGDAHLTKVGGRRHKLIGITSRSPEE